jgi:hypothetical protein
MSVAGIQRAAHVNGIGSERQMTSVAHSQLALAQVGAKRELTDGYRSAYLSRKPLLSSRMGPRLRKGDGAE